MLIGLISCSKAKTEHPGPARELYSSSALFRGALKLLTGRADVVYVLSAKYGLVPLERVLEPYNQTLKQATRAQRDAWARQVLAALQARHGAHLGGITFEFHAGAEYQQPLESLLTEAGAVCTCPVAGLPIGRRLAFYAGRGSPAVVPATRAPAPGATVLPVLGQQVRALRGETLHTGTGLPFAVTEVDDSGLVVMPESTKKPRPIRWRELEDAYELLRRAGELTLAAVRGSASEANPAYVFAILATLPGARLVQGRPLRLVVG